MAQASEGGVGLMKDVALHVLYNFALGARLAKVVVRRQGKRSKILATLGQTCAQTVSQAPGLRNGLFSIKFWLAKNVQKRVDGRR